MSMYHRFTIGDFVDDPTEIFLTFDCYHHTTTTTNNKSYHSGVTHFICKSTLLCAVFEAIALAFTKYLLTRVVN